MEGRVYFTPSPADVGSIAQRLLFTDAHQAVPVSFMSTDYQEHTLFVQEVCTTKEGYTITGELESVDNVVGRISVNTTVEPPVATFENVTPA